MIPKYYFEFLRSKGESLEGAGVNGTGLDRTAALEAAAILRAANVPILGGDVFARKNKKLILTYDNWHCDRDEKQDDLKYIEQCYKTAVGFIENYNGQNEEILFQLIPEE